MIPRDSFQGNPVAELYDRIRYDAELEDEALRCLAQLDLAGCRTALATLIDRLDVSRVNDNASRQIVHLLADVLHRLNGRLHHGPGAESLYRANRLALVEEFGSCDHAEAARTRFMAALNRLLAPLQAVGSEPNPQVERAKGLIDESYSRRISLSSVADGLHISPNYLSRLFRRETGMTLTAYVQRVRIERAMLLLAEGSHSISEIAYRVGYQNYRDFYRNFVKYEKTAPGEFRRRCADRLERPARPDRDSA